MSEQFDGSYKPKLLTYQSQADDSIILIDNLEISNSDITTYSSDLRPCTGGSFQPCKCVDYGTIEITEDGDEIKGFFIRDRTGQPGCPDDGSGPDDGGDSGSSGGSSNWPPDHDGGDDDSDPRIPSGADDPPFPGGTGGGTPGPMEEEPCPDDYPLTFNEGCGSDPTVLTLSREYIISEIVSQFTGYNIIVDGQISANTPEFTNLDDSQNFIDNYLSAPNTFTNSAENTLNGVIETITVNRTGIIGGGFKIAVKQELNPHSIENVTVTNNGLNVLASYELNDFVIVSEDSQDNTITVRFDITETIGIKVSKNGFGIPLSFTNSLSYEIDFSTVDGSSSNYRKL